MGSVMLGLWDWSQAETEFKRAIELNPSYSTERRICGPVLSAKGLSGTGLGGDGSRHRTAHRPGTEQFQLSGTVGKMQIAIIEDQSPCQDPLRHAREVIRLWPAGFAVLTAS